VRVSSSAAAATSRQRCRRLQTDTTQAGAPDHLLDAVLMAADLLQCLPHHLLLRADVQRRQEMRGGAALCGCVSWRWGHAHEQDHATTAQPQQRSLTLYAGSLPSAVSISLMSVVARRVSSAMAAAAAAAVVVVLLLCLCAAVPPARLRGLAGCGCPTPALRRRGQNSARRRWWSRGCCCCCRRCACQLVVGRGAGEPPLNYVQSGLQQELWPGHVAAPARLSGGGVVVVPARCPGAGGGGPEVLWLMAWWDGCGHQEAREGCRGHAAQPSVRWVQKQKEKRQEGLPACVGAALEVADSGADAGRA
jgi:hypothetical protein